MKEKLDSIYIYLWEDLNTVYIGRTKNPKSRHYVHRHRVTEKTYQFSAEHQVEHPKMVIIETNLTLEDGVEREKFWIEHYRNETNYNVLNIRVGGQVGNQHRVYTDEEMKEHRRIYYQNNKEEKISYQKKYNKEKKENIKEYQKKYFLEHKEEKKAYDKEYQKKWYEANKKKKMEYCRKYREARKLNKRKE